MVEREWAIKEVSIPAWCDWEVYDKKPVKRDYAVSIPAWCDWETRAYTRGKFGEKVSIPAWCDWEIV